MKHLYTKKLVLFLVDKDMAIINKLRADQIQKLVREIKNQAATRNKKISTVDPIIKIGKTMYPMLTHHELMEYSQTALRIILGETMTPAYQTTLFAHL
jgi:hypothetical protein